jgi:predicted aldo/keto reductase-like oxidoreductase
MRYRPLGKTGLQVSALSMGCMRLSEDQDLNTRVVSRAAELGINYFETTRGYCGGQCQHRTAPGLQGKTTGLIVSGKAGIGPDTTAYAFRKEIELQLEILGLTHFKFFQVGWFGWDRVSHLLKRGGVYDALRKAQDEGLVHHIGFTGHDTPENFTKIIETGLFDSITVPYNLIHRAYEPTIARAGELGVGVVAMCPVSGGVLATHSTKLQEALGMDMPTAAMALRFVLSNPAVSTACSGMNTVEMVDENVSTVQAFDPETDADFEAMCAGVETLRSALEGKICTACGYCMPCPQGVDIPRHMGEFTKLAAFGLDEWVRTAIRAVPGDKSAMLCDECGGCEEKCPNDIPIRENLKQLREVAELSEVSNG